MKKIHSTLDIHPWKITSTKLDQQNRRLHESITSIGNGYMGMRGNFEENYSADHHRGTYLVPVSGIQIKHVLVGGKMVTLTTMEKSLTR